MLCLQKLLKACDAGRRKELLKERSALRGFRIQDLQKIALRDHHRLRKLISVKPDQFLEKCICLIACIDDHTVAFSCDGNRTRLRDKPRSAFFGALILRRAAHGIDLPAVRKGQFHKGFRVGFDIIGAEALGCTPLRAAARFAVKREGNCIENSCFAGACVAADQKQTACTECFKVD